MSFSTRWLPVFAVLVWCQLGLAQLPVGPRKHAEVAPLEGKLVIDGKLDEAAWGKAPEQTGFEKVGLRERVPIPADVQTSFRVLSDRDRIYFGIRCLEPRMEALTVHAADQHDAAMWSDDDVELFIDPVGDRNEYYQLAINSRGTQVDLYCIERGNTQKAYSAVWQAAAFRGDGFWSVEVALPFGALFHRASVDWSQNWAFSLSRTRTPEPRYYSQFSPGNRYHDVDSFGTLGPVPVDRSRFSLFADSLQFSLRPSGTGFQVTPSLRLENRGGKPASGTLRLTVLAKGDPAVAQSIQLPAKGAKTLTLPAFALGDEGKYPVLVEVLDDEESPILAARFDEWFRYVPLVLKLSEPNYRNTIYPSQTVTTIGGTMRVAIPSDGKNVVARVSLSGPNCQPRVFETKDVGPAIPFEIDADHLPVGDYTLRGEILSGQGRKQEVLAEVETPFRKVGPGAVEARVDAEGNLLIGGVPVFIRGWYGGMNYVRSSAAFPEAQLPRTTNFMMGCSTDTTHETGLYTLRGITRMIDESQAKLDQPIGGAVRAKLREVVAQTRTDRNVIGYYISDEPECRGLSPFYLRSLYLTLRELDPYRFCMIVSRAPAQYMDACDVMCPHPYLSPQDYDDGTRRFANHILGIRNVMRAGIAANDGSKAMWCMPQTFSYGGPTARHPNFLESRWFTYTAVANGAKGIVPFIFNGYWNHMENRIAMDAVFEELALLAPAWKLPGTATDCESSNELVDAIAKRCQRQEGRATHAFLVAANQSYDANDATITCPALKDLRTTQLIVLRENRTVEVKDGVFTDHFGRLGVHVYTTLEALPYLRSLAEIQTEIDTRLAAAAKKGNLLAQPGVKWQVMGGKGLFSRSNELIDGVRNAGGWLPVYGDRSQCQLVFDQPLTFSRVVLYTPSIRDAELQIDDNGEWRTIHAWRDQLLQRLEWKGQPVTTKALRVLPTKSRANWSGRALNEITEMELYR
jgi:hypothetical protein